MGLLAASCSGGSGGAPDVADDAAADPVSANPFRIGRPLVIPHAGGDALFPENTIYAYEQSIALGGEVVDVDVWVAADGVPVAIHDSTVDRTTDGSGKVAELSSTELATLDAGYDFELDGEHPYRGRGIGVPSVEDILRRFPDRLVTLDMKDTRTGSAGPVCALLVRLGRGDDVYVGSDTDEQVGAFRQRCPTIRTSGTSDERRIAREARVAGDATFRSNQLVSQPGYLADDGTPRVTAETVAFSHQSDTAVLTWVIDDPEVMQHLIDIGIDGIYTRHPERLVELLRADGLL
jgi:glycerophosphoryl diester phosphodiesterase